jgi:hypothetical protein
VFASPDLFSLLPVRNPFIVPGGRFREFYYWYHELGGGGGGGTLIARLTICHC